MRILLTAFEPYDDWKQNSSWEALVSLLRERGSIPGVTTRRYPVDLTILKERLFTDLERGFDSVIHLGQSPGISQIHLESIALNVAGITGEAGADFGPLIADGPVAYRTHFPIGIWSSILRQQGIPAAISYHAGTYLCNAAMYLSHHWFASNQEEGSVGFIHLPITGEQVLESGRSYPWMSSSQTATAISLVLDRIRGLHAIAEIA